MNNNLINYWKCLAKIIKFVSLASLLKRIILQADIKPETSIPIIKETPIPEGDQSESPRRGSI
jgi:hypothetical protein